MSYRVVCSKGNTSDIVFMCESYDEAIERIMVNLNEIISDYFDLVRKYEASKDFGLIKGIVYDKEAIYEILEWKIYEV